MRIKKKGFFSYVQSAGMSHWKLAQKYSIFRPFAWLYQIFRLIRKWIEGIIHGRNELKGVMRESKIEEIWRRLE